MIAGVAFGDGAAADHDVPLFPSASDPVRQGFVRIINHAARTDEVLVYAIDDAGDRRGPLVFRIDRNATLHLNSDDLENGNVAKGIRVGTGPGNGDWRLEVDSVLDIEVLSYVRTSDGFLTSMHDNVPRGEHGVYRVAFFNPGHNVNQASSLRLVNAGEDVANVTITGIDDQGTTPGEGVEVEIPAGTSRTFTSHELETGGSMFEGALGDGTGKWRLSVHADVPITVVNLLASPSGELANLSSMSDTVDQTGNHIVPLFPAANDPDDRQGFVRVINRSERSGSIAIESNRDHGQVVLRIDAHQALHFNSDDWELGNAEKGLPGVGATDGDWQLALSSDVDIDVSAYIRNKRDGFVTAMYDDVPAVGYRHRVAVFNPGSNRTQVGQLRLANRGLQSANVSITGIDDHGTPAGGVRMSVGVGEVRTLTALDLETGNLDIDGTLGDGAGKWRLAVESDAPIHVMNLLASPMGHLTNLSSVPANTAPRGQSAFNDRAMDKRMVLHGMTRTVDFLSGERYRETRDGATTTGTYTYTVTGTSAGTLTFTADDGDSCATDLVFVSRISGRLSWCDDDAEVTWRILEPTRRDGDRVTYEVTATVGTLGSDIPEVVRGAIASDGGKIDFDNGGYVEMGDDRYTCRDAAGCIVHDGVVTRGRIVQTPALGARDFEPQANGSPTGLAYADGHFRVVDGFGLRVHAYDAAGNQVSALDFDLAADNRNPAGITVDAEAFYVVDEDDFLDEEDPRHVFVYDASGQHQPNDGFEVDSTVREPLGIAYFNDRLFLADAWTRKVYAYRPSGAPDPDAGFDLDPENGSPRGIAYGDGRFYVVDTFDDKVYAYLTGGERDPVADFDLVDGNSLSRGIAYVDGRFFVADADWVYAYPSDRPDLVIDTFSIAETRPAAGGTFPVNVTLRNIGHRRAEKTTLRYYRSLDATIPRDDEEVGHAALDALDVARTERLTHSLRAPTRAGFYNYGVCIDALPDEYDQRNCSKTLEITVPVDIAGSSVGFALDSENRSPSDMAHHNGRFYVLDSRNDHVYAYRTSAARDDDSDFALDEDNDRPLSMAYANRSFYVIDAGDDKVYAYAASGVRDAGGDFALDTDNSAASGIAFAGGRFYVADRSDDKVYVYDTSGNRQSEADFQLFSGNDTPWSMTFADDRLFVVDLFDDHIYAYSTEGERDRAVEFGLNADNGAPAGIASADGRLYVADSTDDTVYGYAIPKVADLTVDTAAVSDDSPDRGALFTFTASVRNLGDGRAHSAGIRYYLASDREYEAVENLVGTGSVGPLDPDAVQDVTFEMTAPTDDGCYFCGACVDGVRGERVRSNNCATPAEILLGDGPDMDFSRLQMHTGGVGDPVEVTIGVINRGVGTSLPGKLRITGGDDVVVDIPALASNEEQIFERQQIDTGQSGTTTFEMCIDVPCEVDPEDNCRTRTISL